MHATARARNPAPGLIARLAGHLQSMSVVPLSILRDGNPGRSIMRRVVFGCLVFLAACGGDIRKEAARAQPDPAEAAKRQATVVSPEGTALLQKYSALVGKNTLDTCLRGWFGETASGEPSSRRPVYKPDLDGFRDFLCDCA